MQIRNQNDTSCWRKPVGESIPQWLNFDTIRVLAVDDEPFARAVMAMLLKDEPGFELVASARDGYEAVRLIDELRPDLVLMDVAMPGLSGLEVLQRTTVEAPMVIFTTADEKIGSHAYELNAVDYLIKPYTRARFRRALDRARERYQTRAAAN